MIELLFEPAFWGTLAILVGLELALGVDNIVFVSLVMARVPADRQARARRIGLGISALIQIALLFIMLWIAGVERTAFTIAGWSPSWGELAFLAGGLFLVYKAVTELHLHIEHGPRTASEPDPAKPDLGFGAAIAQVAAINAVFSVDTIITAVGVTRSLETIVIAILVTTGIIYAATAPISAFIARHPSVRALALAFLMMIGGSLISEGLGIAIDTVLLYAVIGTGAAVLLAVKLAERWRERGERAAVDTAPRREPTLDADDAEVPVRDEEVLEEPVPVVQKSAPKRRAPKSKTARRAKASPQE